LISAARPAACALAASLCAVAEAARRGDGPWLHAEVSACLPLGAALLEAVERPDAARILRKVAENPAENVPVDVLGAEAIAARADDASSAAAAAGLGATVPELLEQLVGALAHAMDSCDSVGGVLLSIALDARRTR
jgi:hypothetical protein